MDKIKRNMDYFKVGQIYNKSYFGTNEAYKKQNGQKTIKILKCDEKTNEIEYEELFYTYSDRVDDLMVGGTIYWGLSSLISSQKEYTYENTTDTPEKWYRHIQRMSMTEAVNSGLVDIENVEYMFRNQSGDYIRQSPVLNLHFDGNYAKMVKMSVIQGVSDNSMLQTIQCLWNSQEEMEKDVRNVFTDAWFM